MKKPMKNPRYVRISSHSVGVRNASANAIPRKCPPGAIDARHSVTVMVAVLVSGTAFRVAVKTTVPGVSGVKTTV